MKKTLINLAVAATIASLACSVRARTHDVAFGFRMGAGFPGDVNRTHPASIIAGLMDPTTPVRLFGDVVLTGTNTYKGIAVGDTSTLNCAGVAVRPYPTQQTSGGMTSSFGNGAPATNQPLDIINDGYVMMKCNSGTPAKGGLVYVYTGASTGAHVQGSGVEAASGSNLTLVSNLMFNGPADANGIVEVRVIPAVA